MKLTAQVKLLPAPEQAQFLKQTLEEANAACNYISLQAWENKTFRQFDLHKLTYRDVRKNFQLSAQATVRCISKVADAYKTGKHVMRAFKKYGGIAFDSRILSYNLEKMEVSIWTVGGRQHIPFSAGTRQLELLSGQRGESDLCLIGDRFYLFVACDVEAPEQKDIEGILGCEYDIIN